MEALRERGKPSETLRSAAALAGFAILSVGMFAGEILLPGDTIRSHHFGDLRLYFIGIREFGFAQLANGNLALWNPHLFSGTPFVGSFQAAMLYPLNLLYLLLPLVRAIHADLALHVFLIGAFLFGWMRARGIAVTAAFFAAAVLMFGQATSSRIMAGQLTLIAVSAWTPLLFWSADKLLERPTAKWTLIGVGAASMQLLAGYPQLAFMTATGLGIYCAIRLINASNRVHSILALSAVAIAPLFISSVQLWTGLYAMAETIRANGVSFEFATSYSFPPENLLTTLVPGFFGNFAEIPYWGRWVFWDANAYIGATALFCGVIGFIYAPKDIRMAFGIMAVALFVLCLGKYTPAYRLVYDWIPGFDRFRAPSKYLFLVTLAWSVFAAYGMDRFVKNQEIFRGAWIAPAVAGVLLAGAASSTWTNGAAQDSLFGSIFARVLASPDCVTELYSEPKLSRVAPYAALNLTGASVACFIVAVAIANARRSALIPLLLVLFGVAEVFGVARAFSSTIRLQNLERPELAAVYAEQGEHRRVLDTLGRNDGLNVGGYSLWGYDPVILKRYAEFIQWTRGESAGDLTRVPQQHHAMMDMLRCGTVAVDRGIQPPAVSEVGPPLPRFLLVRSILVHNSPDAIREVLIDPEFDPRKTVVLEEALQLEMDGDDARGNVELIDSSTDHMTLHIHTPSPAILLITDAYSRGWRAVALDDSAEDEYRILPANRTLRAIPLTAGQHRIRVEYAPWPYRIGKWVSVISTVIYVLALAWLVRNGIKRRRLLTRQSRLTNQSNTP